MKQENYIARVFLQENIHGPNHAIPVANSEPNSWPNVAPAPMNPNNLEPDWIQDWINDLENSYQ